MFARLLTTAGGMVDPETGAIEEVDKDEYFNAIVHVKSFLQFLSSHVVSHTTIASKSSLLPWLYSALRWKNGLRKLILWRSAGICEGHCLIMYVYIFEGDDHGGVLTFYIPAAVP